MRNNWQRLSLGWVVFGLLSQVSFAQEAEVGVSVPFTLSGQVMKTHRLQSEDPGSSTSMAGFRAMFYPSVKLGSHWFGYAALQVRSEPYFLEEAYSADREVEAQALQAFVGYTRSGDFKSFLIKAGQLSSAFGSFLPRYDDAANPLIDLPQGYGYYYKPVSFSPVTGVEVDASLSRLDARFQVVNSSPMNPQGVRSSDQHLQWAGGAGYTIRQGFRIGVSAYRGAFMRQSSRFLSVGDRSEDYPATGLGADLQWASGRWSFNGEWQRFDFPYPRLATLVVQQGYGEAKIVLTPRFYAAVRAGYQNYTYLASDRQNYDFVVGYRPNRFQLVKVGYQWLKDRSVAGTYDDVWAVQYVTSIDVLRKSFR
jgi:hypothetical protein